MGGKLDCHRTKGVTRMGQWEVNQIVTEQRVQLGWTNGSQIRLSQNKGVARMGQEVNQIVREQRCNQDGPIGGKLDCHRTKGVTKMGQWEVNQIVTEQKV